MASPPRREVYSALFASLAYALCFVNQRDAPWPLLVIWGATSLLNAAAALGQAACGRIRALTCCSANVAVLALCILYQARGRPLGVWWDATDNWKHLVSTLLFTPFHKGYGSDLLPGLKPRLLLSELMALSHWLALLQRQPSERPWLRFLAHQLFNTVLPLWWYPAPAHILSAQLHPCKASKDLCGAETSTAARRDVATPAMPRTPTTSADVRGTTVSMQAAPVLYRSLFEPRQQVCFKLATDHHPYHLDTAATARLTELLRSHIANCNPDAPVPAVLHASVRSGCILITLDCVSGPPLPAAATANPLTEADVTILAKAMLPCLLSELGLTPPDTSIDTSKMNPCTHQLGPGQYLRLQLGDRVTTASLRPDTQEWVFETVPLTDLLTGTSMLQLTLPCPQPAAANGGSTAARPLAADSPAFSFTVRLHQEGSAACALAVAAECVTGSDPSQPRTCKPDAGTTSTSSPVPLELWVHCQGQYLLTQVQHMGGNVLQVSVTVPPAVLARHHQPSGPAARLQLFTAELWAGPDVLLSRAHLMADSATHFAPPVPPTTFGWWGVGAASAGAAVGEVTRLTGRVIDLAESGSAWAGAQAGSHAAFVYDITVWLMAMQQRAGGTCSDLCNSARPPVCDVTDEQCVTLASKLLTRAATAQLPAIAAIVRTQQATVLQAWLGRQLQSASSPIIRSAAMQQLSGQSLCDQCDLFHYQRVRENALGYMAVAVGVLGSGSVAFSRLSADCPLWLNVLVHVAGAFRVLGWLVAADTHVNRGIAAWQLQLGSWLLHVLVQALLPLGVISGAGQRLGVWYTTIVPVVAVVAQQVCLWGCVPTWLVRALVTAEMAVHLQIMSDARYNHQPVYLRVLYVASQVLAPSLLDRHFRRQLRRAEPQHAAEGTESVGRRAKFQCG